MNKIVSLLKNLRLRQILTVFMAGLTVFVMQAFGNILPAQADQTVESPYGYYYKGTPDGNAANRDRNILNQQDRSAYRNDNQMVENARTNLKSNTNSGETVESPYGYYYKGTPDENVSKGDRNVLRNDNELVENSKNSLKSTADNIREKLNLDEPLPRSTKEFLKSTEEKVEETVKPITGKREGYYQEK